MAGDEYEENISDSQGRLRGFLGSLHPYPHEVNDVLQETNLTLLKKREDYDPSRKFLPWAFSIARFTLMAYRKKRARELNKISYGASAIYDLMPDDKLGEDILYEMEVERLRIINSIRSELSARALMIFDDFLEGKSCKQISEEMNLPIRTIYSYRHRTVVKARKILLKQKEKLREEIENREEIYGK